MIQRAHVNKKSPHTRQKQTGHAKRGKQRLTR